jgi:hypothetical protein
MSERICPRRGLIVSAIDYSVHIPSQKGVNFSLRSRLRFQLRVNAQFLRLWHVALLERVSRRAGLVATLDLVPSGAGLGKVAQGLLLLDRAVYGTTPILAGPARPDSAARFQHHTSAPPDIVLDLSDEAHPGAGRRWRLTFDGADTDGLSDERALMTLLLRGEAPVARIREAERVVAVARLGTEHNGSLLSSMDDFLSRTITLVEAALAGTAQSITVPPPGPPAPPPSAVSLPRAGRIAARHLALSMVRHAYRLHYASPHWRVGWRHLDGPDLFDLRRHPDGGWRNLPDDGHRFYADPFPIEHDGGVTVFLEEFAHRSGKGIVSAVQFGAAGPVGRPVPVLELPYHLSYPFVFARDGAFWMVPESCASGTIDLFRATDFPGGWVKAATLVADIVASDATLVEHAGRWWMFATVRDGGGAFSDALHLWWAADFRGPWTPHPGNPVLIDVASARPAGRMVVRRGALLRPVQDCRLGYGRALGIARVTRLDEAGFEQVVETTLGAGPQWPGNRLHTLNSAGGFEFIDGSARVRRRFWRRT